MTRSVPQPELPKQKLSIRSRNGREHTFFVEVATTLDQQKVGLMLRETLPPYGGMLFDWGVVRNNKMWMRDTLNSLDIIFVAEAGIIHRIAANNMPGSLDIIDSNGLIRATLELPGGTVERENIQVGDRVIHPIFESAS
jgi:uncharacterized membrane protein (UPF0127 family)